MILSNEGYLDKFYQVNVLLLRVLDLGFNSSNQKFSEQKHSYLVKAFNFLN